MWALPSEQGVEILQASALEAAGAAQPDAYEREHVSPFLYRRPDRFRILRPQVPLEFLAPEARVTVDTADDLEYLRKLWEALYRGQALEAEDFISWLKLNSR